MKKSKINKKIYSFIDSQNLNLGVRSSGWILDFRKFRILLKEKYIEYLNDNSKLLKILVPNSKYSSLLRKFADKIVQVNLFRKKVEKTKKGGIPSRQNSTVVLPS